MFLLWLISGSLGLGLYGRELVAQWRMLVQHGLLRSLAGGWEGQVAAGSALVATLFVKTALVLGAHKFGRPLDLAALLLFAPLNAVCEGLGLLALFDLGRCAAAAGHQTGATYRAASGARQG